MASVYGITRDRKTLKRKFTNPSAIGALAGTEDLSTWDLEELLMGRRRDSRGRLVGKPASIVPRRCVEEAFRRISQDAMGEMLRAAGINVEKFLEICAGNARGSHVQLNALIHYFNMVFGKPTEKVDVSVTDAPWKEVYNTSIVGGFDEAEDDMSQPVIEVNHHRGVSSEDHRKAWGDDEEAIDWH